MLSSLTVKNYALIETLSVNFNKNLSIITGETGAGKSILLGALGLALGKRADITNLKDTQKKCIIEANFKIKNYQLQSFFLENDIDFEEETIVRREILPSGKSRAFINDTPTTLNILQQLSEKLIDIHSQHQTLELANTNFQFELLDALAKNKSVLEKYTTQFLKYKNLKKEFKNLQEQQAKFKEQYQYNLHLYEELNKANLKIEEQEEVEEKLNKLNNVEAIKLNLAEAQYLAFEEERGIQSLLNSFKQKIASISNYSKEYQTIFERVNSLKIEFDDIAYEIENYNENVDFNEEKLEYLNNRLQLIFDLQKKHQVTSITDLLKINKELKSKVELVENASEIVLEKEKELNQAKENLTKTASTLTKSRKKTIPILTKEIEYLLEKLGMENSRFKLELSTSEHFLTNGKDNLTLLLSADKGQTFGDLKKIASGGEMSRIMLAIKAILSEYEKLPTIIFDEIDTGVSGDISQRIAEIMQKMAKNMQVITITHLPQIAASGNWHYKVYKTEKSKTITTQLKPLNKEERIAEIAEMLSGKNYTQTAIEHAKQLLK